MRTKTLLIAAATTLVAGLFSAQADTVYSQNVVGYINITVNPGFNLIANQLNKDNTNGVNEVLPPTESSQVLKWNGSGFTAYTFDSGFGGWIDDGFNNVNPSVNPGEAFFYFSPANNPTNLTLVGNVKTGTNSITLPPGFFTASAIVPYAGAADSANLNITIIDTMQVLEWNGSSYAVTSYDSGFGGWIDDGFNNVPAPNLSVGEGIFYFNPNNNATNWTEVFNNP